MTVENVLSRPDISASRATEIAKEIFDLQCDAKELPSERDRNFKVQGQDDSYVLKFANSNADATTLELQNATMLHLNSVLHHFSVPHPVEIDGQSLFEINDQSDQTCVVRLVSYLFGKPFAKIQPHSRTILQKLGTCVGELTKALTVFDHPAAYRDFYWDLCRSESEIQNRLDFVNDAEQNELLRSLTDQMHSVVNPLRDELPKSIIHGDLNDYNLIVETGLDLTNAKFGAIDFGDMLHSWSINDLAICLGYIFLDKDDPLAAAREVVRGFCEQYELSENELKVLFPLAVLRLCMSVAISSEQNAANPDNKYLTVTSNPAWKALARLREIPLSFAEATFRSVAGFSPIANSQSIQNWLSANQTHFAKVVEAPLEDDIPVLDLSVESSDSLNEIGETAKIEKAILRRIEDAGKAIGWGRYNEPRTCYAGEQFGGEERRTIHLGVDLFADVGTEVFCPIEGKIHSFQDNQLDFDYGPTIIIEHQTDAGEIFHTLYGHLSRESLAGLQIGQPISTGQKVGSMGDMSVNGGWPSHLHFQVMIDMFEKRGDFPGVAAPSEIDVWLSNGPDPNLILGCNADVGVKVACSDTILESRRKSLSPNMSVSYSHDPIQMVRGDREFLFDQLGREYLDGVNNVCHVGHCHPVVTRAIRKQATVLNTNTRYLHQNLADYAERLTATFPDPLNVCFFVCTGSEANDLALRLARNYTGGEDIICVEGGYHGHLTSLIGVSSYKFDRSGGTGAPPATHLVPMPDSFRGLHCESQGNIAQQYASYVEEICGELSRKRRKDNRKLAAFICESILSCAGQIVLPDGYLKAAYESVRKVGGVCIADEVQVGFGRCGESMWAFETQGVIPDIVTLGKPIGNGHPMAAVITTREIADAFNNGMEYFNTFGGNPVSCAAGLAVLDVIENENLQANAKQVGEFLLSEFSKLQESFPQIGDVRGMGLFLGLEFVRDVEGREPFPKLATFVANRMREKRILLSTDGMQENVIKFKPPLVFSMKSAHRLVAQLDLVLKEALTLL